LSHGVNYTDKILVNVTGGYYVELENWAGHYEPDPAGSGTVFVYDDSGNTYSGSLYVWRVLEHYPSAFLLTTGWALLGASFGLLAIPTLMYLRFKAKRFGKAF
jgi:hypothetical protein